MTFSTIIGAEYSFTVIVVGLLSAIYLVCLAIYRLWFHPLAKFPGSKFAALTHWYEAYFDLIQHGGSQYTPKIRDMHAKYGPIIRINPDEISVNDAAFHDKLYAPRPHIRDRYPPFSAFLGTTKGTFSTVDYYLHRNRRTAYANFFSTANVAASEPMTIGQIEHMSELLWNRRNENPDLRTYLAALSFDGFYTWAFGNKLNLMDNLDLAWRCNYAVESAVTGPPLPRIFPTIMGIARAAPPWILRRLSKRVAQVFDLHAMITQASNQYVANLSDSDTEREKPLLKVGSSPETLFSCLRSSRAPAEEKTAYRMAQEGIEMFMAAFTPGRTMMTAMFYLHENLEVLKALRRELDNVNPDPTNILSYKILNTIPYMRAVMKEVLRTSFPVGSRLPLVCHEDIQYQNWVIPAKTPVSVNHRNLLFDPEVFHEPFKFKPERWLDEQYPID